MSHKKGEIDYAAVHVPEGKRPEEYHYTERRAEILNKIRSGSSPWQLNQSELARRYDVSQPTIHKDLKRLKTYLKDNLGEDAELEANELFRDVVDNIRNDAQALRQQGERSEAARAEKAAAAVADKWYDWLFEAGIKDRAPRRTEVDASVDIDKRETKVYAGVDVSRLPGIDEARMVGMTMDADDEDEDEGDGADDEEAVEVEVD